MNEFGLIARYFTHPAPNADLGVGDDCALMRVGAGMQLAVSVDMLVSGRHFFADTDPYRLGHKTLAVNLSDLAATGAAPRWFTLALALPELNEDWLSAFSQGLMDLAREHQISLVGGDTTRGPLTMSIQVAGEVPYGQALLRSGARPGDELWVSGSLGAAAAAVMHGLGRVSLGEAARAAAFARLEQPTPRVALGLRLRGLASAALDISDGLAGDVRHIAERSACAVVLDLARLPAHELLAEMPAELRREALLAGGDDYELCFSAPASAHADLLALSSELGVALTCVGHIEAGEGVWLQEGGRRELLALRGFDHFGVAP